MKDYGDFYGIRDEGRGNKGVCISFFKRNNCIR